MNLQSSHSRDGLSPYQIFFGQKICSKFKHAFSIVSDAAKTERVLKSLRLFASVMRTNGVNPTKKESINAIQTGDTFSINMIMEDDELNDFPIFTQMKDEVFNFSSHALRSHEINERLPDKLSDAEHEERLPKKKRKMKVTEGSKGLQQQRKKKQKCSKKTDDTTGTNESTSRSSNKRK
jgi:hypothetical protein